ncbi:hypothetical protein ACG3RN_21485, partial [Pseudomonas aeruginosa]
MDALVRLAPRPLQRLIGILACLCCLNYAGLFMVASSRLVRTSSSPASAPRTSTTSASSRPTSRWWCRSASAWCCCLPGNPRQPVARHFHGFVCVVCV